LLEEFEHQISELVIIPSRGGVYEVEVDGELVYSKKATGRHAEPDEILKSVRKLVG
jgi:selenoprotein W-related protein